MINIYEADVISAQDYDPFGMLLPGREWQEGYRFGFNGKEQDPEQLGQGNIYDYGFRIYNPRLGKFSSVDPLLNSYPDLTPYQFSNNRPIDGIDLDGLEYISADKCLVQFNNGVAVIKFENLSKLHRARVNNYNTAHKLPLNQYPEYIGIFEFSEETADATDMKTKAYDQQKEVISNQTVTEQTPTNKKNSVKNTKTTTKSIKVNITSTKSSSKSNAATLVMLAIEVTERIVVAKADYDINNDISTISEQMDVAEKLLKATARALTSVKADGSQYIPTTMSDPLNENYYDHMSNIVNYMLYGGYDGCYEYLATSSGFISVAEYEAEIKHIGNSILTDFTDFPVWIENQSNVNYNPEYTGGNGLDGFQGQEVPVITISNEK